MKPCWCSVFGILVVSSGRIVFSRHLAMGERSEIGLYELPSLGFLLGFGIGMIFASFQICGMVLSWIERLYVCVRYAMAMGPRCFR